MAALLDVLRTEQKYRLTVSEAARVSGALSGVLHLDEYSKNGAYQVRSLYFDTPGDRDFYEKVDGYECRRKIRLRIYDPAGKTAKLELKEKQGSLQRKRSLTLPREAAVQLCRGNYRPLLENGSEFALELYGRMEQYQYRPKCLIEYSRKAFTVPENNIRITFDYELRASECNMDLFQIKPALYPVAALWTVTMEVKFNRFLLSYVKNLLSLPARTQTSASKYVMARNQCLRKDY